VRRPIHPVADARGSAGRHAPAGARKPIPLPVTRREMDARGWDACDVVIVSGDAYVDHPSFGAAVVGRFLESLGYRVGILAQPDPSDPASFLALGAPRLFWGVTAGNVDSQLATWTVMRKRRRDDPYSPGGRAGRRPANATIVYTSLARAAAKGVPVVIGGIEASLRRFPYYDYWTDKVRRSLLFDAKADYLVFGMAERALAALAADLRDGRRPAGIRGTAEIRASPDGFSDPVILPSFEEVSAATEDGKAAFVAMTRTIFLEHHAARDRVLVQPHGDRWLVVHPPAHPLEPDELDRLYALPFTRRPHPSYGNVAIPAYEMIRDSITTHRGCYAACAFCAIAMHQGAAVTSRSEGNIVAEIERMAATPNFHGTISDLGGPTANMYGTACKLGRPGCAARNCLTPEICANLSADPAPLLALMKRVRAIRGVRHAFVSSGIRFDLAMAGGGTRYIGELVRHHVSGRLKIAPEHVSADVLRIMRKPPADAYTRFVAAIRDAAKSVGRACPIVEYFISGHPGCTLRHMVELAEYLHRNQVKPEQVQDFYPAPLTLAAAMFYTGVDPLTGERVHVARTDREKALQRALLLHHKPEFHRKAREALREASRPDRIGRDPDCLVPPGP
jgi:uncharacterized radical SAM protein YgiQ